MDWLERAKRLPLGRKQRIAHDCSLDKSMVVSHGEQGYSAYCFRCGPVGFHAHGYRTLEELNRVQELNKLALEPQSPELPDDYTDVVPPQHLLWLARAGISAGRAKRFGIGWSARLGRVVLPVYDRSGSLVYWQARAVSPGQTPKYINPPADKNLLCYWVDDRADRTRDTGVCVTEDILSAIRVGRHMRAASILGTKLSASQEAQITRATRARVFVWLDPDQAGRDGSSVLRRKMGMVIDTTIIESDADPKCLPDRLIREHLGLPPNHKWSINGVGFNTASDSEAQGTL